MKRILFLYILLLFCGITVFAEDVSIYTYFIITPKGEYQTLYFAPHKEVKINEKYYISYSGFFDTDSLVEDMFFIRKDELKYFCYDKKCQTEHLLFDFNLQKGDTYTDDFSNITYEVTDVRDTIINTRTLKLIELQGRDSDGKHDVWIENVGSVYTGLLPVNEYCKDIYLLTNNHFVETVYESDFFSYPFYPCNQYIKTAYMDVTKLEWEKQIETEEDYYEYLNWYNAPSKLNAEFIGDTLRIWGRLRTTCGKQPYAGCELKANNVTFKTYRYDGAEADCIGVYEIETRIPGFSRGKYSVKILNKTIELENTESIYTSVNNVTESSSLLKGSLYNLQGFRINSQLKKGIYIQNGKKVAVK